MPSSRPAPGSPSPLGWSDWWRWLSSSYLPARGADRGLATVREARGGRPTPRDFPASLGETSTLLPPFVEDGLPRHEGPAPGSEGTHSGEPRGVARRPRERDVVRPAHHATGRVSPRPDGSRSASRSAAATTSRSGGSRPLFPATAARSARNTAWSLAYQLNVLVRRPLVARHRASAIPQAS